MAETAGAVVVADDGRYVRILNPNSRCKSCRPEWQQPVLELLLADHTGTEPMSLTGMCRQLSGLGVELSRVALRNHRDAHCEFGHGARSDLIVFDKDPRQREQEFRTAAIAELDREHVTDARGAHISYLEDVVAVSAQRIRHFPEHVTLEMGLRAASELTKAKQSAERDELLKMLALSAARSGGHVAQGREMSTARRKLPVLEAAAAAEA